MTTMPALTRYAVAVGAVALSFAIRLIFQPWLGTNVPYLQFFPAIMVAARVGGMGPGATATLCSAGVAMYALLPPSGRLTVGATSDVVSLSLFVAVGLGISWAGHMLREAEAALRAAAGLAAARAERLDAVLRTAIDGIIVINPTGEIEEFNQGAERMFGYPAAEVLGRNVSVLMPSPDHEAHDQYLGRYLQSGSPRIIGIGREVRGRRRDGSTFPLHLSVGEMHIGGERKFTGLLHDLSTRARLEGQVRNSEARWRAIVESAVDGIVVIDTYGRIEAFNPAAERLFGYPEQEVLGQNVKMLMPSPYHDEHDRYLARYHATHDPRIIGKGREVTGRRKDGTTFPLHLSVGELSIEGQAKFTGILHDLTARVDIETRLREQATLARLGEMAAVVAHEVKNPLAGVRSALQVLGQRMPPDGRDLGIVKEIITRLDSLNDLMKDLLLFARPPRPRPTRVEIASLMSTTMELLTGDPAVKDVQVEVNGTAPPIDADPELLKIVFQNLIVNAAHAMNGQGRIQIDVRPNGGECLIAVADNGPGIPLAIREKIFTPFFTTKSRGSGLGLPTAKSLIEAHQGRIVIECPSTGGTVVTVFLPTTHSAV